MAIANHGNLHTRRREPAGSGVGGHGARNAGQSRSPISPDRWDRALAQCEDAEIYHTWAWQQIVARVYGYAPRPALVRDGDREIPVTTFHLRTLRSGRKVTNMPFMFQAPPLAQGTSFDRAWSAHHLDLAGEYRASVELKLRRRLDAETASRFGLHEAQIGWHSAVPLAATHAEQLGLYTKNLRKNLKRSANRLAREDGFRLSAETTPHSIRAFHTCMMRMYRDKDHIPCQPLGLFREMQRCFCADDLVRLFAVWDGERLVSGVLMLRWGLFAEYGWGATAAGYERWNLPTILLDRGIGWAISRGARTMSFGCSGLHDNGLLEFKKRWGCTQQPVYSYSWPRPIRPLDSGSPSRLVGAVYSRLPLWLIRPALPLIVPQVG